MARFQQTTPLVCPFQGQYFPPPNFYPHIFHFVTSVKFILQYEYHRASVLFIVQAFEVRNISPSDSMYSIE